MEPNINTSRFNIEANIKWIKEVEKRRPSLTACSRLITVDASDGSGKSTIAQMLSEELAKRHKLESVHLLDITNLKTGSGQERLRKIKQGNQISHKTLDLLYTAGINRAYREIVEPLLQSGKIVVLDRSEIDSLRFALETGDNATIEKRENYIRSGALTARLWAGNRIFIKVSVNDAWANLQERGNLGPFDPHSLEEVRKRIKFENEAEMRILQVAHQGNVNSIEVTNHRISDTAERRVYMENLVQSLAEKIAITPN